MKITGQPHVVRAEKGTTNKTCRHWYLRINTDQGRKQKRFSGTYTDAKRAAQEFAATLTVPQGKMRFSALADKWLDRRSRSGRYDETTIRKDTSIVNRLNGQFGDMTLCDMTYSVIADGLLTIKESGDLRDSYFCSIQSTLARIMDLAVHEGELRSNPTRDLVPPKRSKTRRKALQYDKLVSFVQRLKMEPMDAHTMALRLLIFAGLRRGEATGLNWSDIDLTHSCMTIARSVTDAGKIKDPKTSAGIRMVPLMANVRDDLETWQRLQERLLSAIGIKQTLDTPVLTSIVGTRLNPQNLDRWWRKNRKAWGLGDVVLHELRHTFATLLANSGAKLHTLPGIMGWSDIEMINTYVHPDESVTRESMRTLESILSGIV